MTNKPAVAELLAAVAEPKLQAHIESGFCVRVACMASGDDVPFDQTVRVSMPDNVGVSIPVRTAMEAAQQLLNRDDWPKSAARNHLKARQACLEVLQGIREARAAREAFEAVAKDAGILRPPVTIPAQIEGYRTASWKGRRKLKRDR